MPFQSPTRQPLLASTTTNLTNCLSPCCLSSTLATNHLVYHCNGLIIYRKLGACTSATARTLHFGRHCSRSLSQPNSSLAGEQLSLCAQPLAAAKSCCPISVRLQIGELAHPARPHNSQGFFKSSARTLHRRGEGFVEWE